MSEQKSCWCFRWDWRKLIHLFFPFVLSLSFFLSHLYIFSHFFISCLCYPPTFLLTHLTSTLSTLSHHTLYFAFLFPMSFSIPFSFSLSDFFHNILIEAHILSEQSVNMSCHQTLKPET